MLGGSPAAYWRLGEASGTTVNDSSSNGRSGTYVTGVTLGQPGAIAADTSASFNGTNGRAQFGDVFDFTGNSPFTIEAFVQPTVIDAWHRRILGKEEKNAVGRFEGYRFAIDTSLGLYCERWSNGANVIVNRPASNFTLGQWYHVACVYDGVSLRLFVNGAQIVAKSSSLPIANTAAQVTVGSYTNGGSSSFWAGGMDELAVYARGLTASELAAHVQAAAPPPGRRRLRSPAVRRARRRRGAVRDRRELDRPGAALGRVPVAPLRHGRRRLRADRGRDRAEPTG